MKILFTNEEKRTMKKNGVPEVIAYNRLKCQFGWDRERAITEALNYGKSKRKNR